MNSLEWRIKRLEENILGQAPSLAYFDRMHANSQNSIMDQLNVLAQQYQNFLVTSGKSYPKFMELYEKHKDLSVELEYSFDGSETSKAELVLAYEEDLLKFMHDIKTMAEKAEEVLDVKSWPDLSCFDQKLEKLRSSINTQERESAIVDRRLEELVRIYKELLDLLQNNTEIWNRKLESYENEDRSLDENI